MTNKFRLIIFLPFLLLGCSPNVIEENKLVELKGNVKLKTISQDEDN